MILHYHTLVRWLKETAPDITHAKIIEVFSQSRDVLTIGMVTASRRPCAIEVSGETGLAHIALRKEYRRKSKNSVDLFNEIIGQKIETIALDAYDRILRIGLPEGKEIRIELYGTVNVFYLSRDKTILAAFKDSKEYLGRSVKPASVKSVHRIPLKDFAALKSEVKTMEGFKNALSEGLAHFNKYLVMECLYAADDLETGFHELKNILRRLKSGKPRIYWIRGEPKVFSLIPLNHLAEKYPDLHEEKFESVNDAIQIYIAKKSTFLQKEKKLQEVLRAIRMRIKKNRALAESLSAEKREAEGFALIEQKAHLLNLHTAEIRRGMDAVMLPNIYDPAQPPLKIGLNPEWAPQKNVEHYFSLAKKMKISVNKIAGRIHDLEEETQKLLRMQTEFETAETRDWRKIEKIHDTFVHSGWIKKISVQTKVRLEKEPPAFREFVVSGNWRVFVGQNDTKNDQLTFQFAKSDDWWFHARGVPGSHVILKRDGRKDNPGKIAIEMTASIAAYFSKAKSSSLVPVTYTLKKYVRKPKGFRPGQVKVDREEVVIVPPLEPKEKGSF